MIQRICIQFGIARCHYSCYLPRQLGRKDIDLLDNGRLCEKLGSFRHQCGRDAPGEVRLPARVVREGVEDAERRWTESYREPRDGCGLRLDHRQAPLEEACDPR